MSKEKAKPFVKWAGGKRGLIDTYEERGFFPFNFKRYFEPMVGGGALFFHIAQKYKPDQCILSDVNADLIDVYRVIKINCEELIEELTDLKIEYKSLGDEDQEEFYYERRDEFNEKKLRDKDYPVRKAALFIFLNKTCYNGLYRVNSKGEFNVPYGRYKNPGIFYPENLRNISELLKNVELYQMDFGELLFNAKEVEEEDFIYFDPPYIPLSETADFTSYSEGGFDHEEQIRLADTLDKLVKNGCYVMESNSGSAVTKKIYEDYERLDVYSVQADRFISCKGDDRGKVEEVVIIGGYQPEPEQKTLPIQE